MNSLREAIKRMVERNTELLQGIVISESPLKIQAVNDSKLIITDISAIIPRHLTDYETAVNLEKNVGTPVLDVIIGENISLDTHENGKVYQQLKFKVRNSLKKGEKVHILAVQNGKKYFILGRV